MGKMTGLEETGNVPPKVLAMYDAVIAMLAEGVDAVNIRVSTITERAGIGKGTAYEYFDTKDKIVACAIAYHLRRIFAWLGGQLESRKNFGEQVNFLLDVVEEKEHCKEGFLRFVQMMVSNSELNRMVREKVGREEFAPYLPANVFGKVLRQGVERGELRGDLPVEYMIHCVFSHVLSYMMEIANRDCFRLDAGAMRPFVYQGIMGELGA
ncbi:TetR/AcrR family transcriptional regulator [Acetatifactor aquisgranensis]|uniref:TetR/AcrR family transcriptional regulator n=1 Tax=Acetatifactor aquisgranensis TaxID=2941233 RepID=UPI00203DEFB1|nr:TetR/AcrR family transcriptional regulator [Acetatifactor aquisgranensis]